MAIVPGYKHDVFVSYAQADDVQRHGWVRDLVSSLTDALQQRLGRTDVLSIWMDSGVATGDLSTSLRRSVEESTAILIVLSSAYVRSEWCLRELAAFLDSKAATQDSDRRVFLVYLEPIGTDQLPSAFAPLLSNLIGLKFFETSDEGFVRPLERKDPSRAVAFYEAVSRLCDSFIRLFMHLRDRADQGAIAADKAEELPPQPTALLPTSQRIEEKRVSGNYDVFLCHNSDDKPDVKSVGVALLHRDILPWLDEWDLRPGLSWQQGLEFQISTIAAAAVFVGPSGFAPWQNMELDAFLREFVRRKCPVIPVILSSCAAVPSLPLFLRGLHWVDFRSSTPDPLAQLEWGITGKRPVHVSAHDQASKAGR